MSENSSKGNLSRPGSAFYKEEPTPPYGHPSEEGSQEKSPPRRGAAERRGGSRFVRVKICGITRLADGLLAAALGADAIGFVFFEKSPRNISLKKAAEIAREMPKNVAKIGVFVRPSREFAKKAAETTGLDAVQLHNVSRRQDMLKIGSLPTILAIPVRESGLDAATAKLIPMADVILLDAYHPTKYGGAGKTFNWDFAAEIATREKIILAGGLTPENIRAAVKTVRPYAVDVSSGVEASPGVKDENKLKRFFKNIEDFRDGETGKNSGFFSIP